MMEYRIVPLQLLEKLQKLTDEECEVNLRLSIEEAIKGPSLQITDIREDFRYQAERQMSESRFYL